MKKIFILILLFSLGIGNSQAQDPFFSQLYYAPGYLNPSLLGLSSRCFSARAVTKAQYVGLYQRFQFDNLYGSTFLNSINHGFSINYLNLKEGDALLKTNSISAALGGKIDSKFGPIAYGVQYSNVRKFIDANRLVFPDQLDKLAGLTGIPTAAILQLDEKRFKDLSVGVSFAKIKNKYKYSTIEIPSWLIGASIDHIIQPNYNFLGGVNVTPMRIYIHFQTALPVKKQIYKNNDLILVPEIMLFSQGQQRTQQIGVKVYRAGLGFVGLYARGNVLGSLSMDAICLNFCFSPINTLTKKQNNKGKVEYGIIAQLEQPVGNVNYISAGKLNNNNELGLYMNSAICKTCFPETSKYSKSLSSKIQRLLRRIYTGKGKNVSLTDCTQFINN